MAYICVICESLWRCWLDTSFLSDDESLTYTSRTNSMLSPGLKAILHKVLQGVSYGVFLVNKHCSSFFQRPFYLSNKFHTSSLHSIFKPPFLLVFPFLISFRRVSKEIHLECWRCGSEVVFRIYRASDFEWLLGWLQSHNQYRIWAVGGGGRVGRLS